MNHRLQRKGERQRAQIKKEDTFLHEKIAQMCVFYTLSIEEGYRQKKRQRPSLLFGGQKLFNSLQS